MIWRKLFLELQKHEQCSERYTSLTTRAADNIRNITRNRYYNVLAYDHSRVQVDTEENSESYINANYVHVPKANRKYILTQGPLDRTTEHFWLMCYQQECPAILMLCKCREIETDKCAQYWPGQVGDTRHFPAVNLSVKLQEENCEDQNHFTVRTLLITDSVSKETREVKHFQYVTWPDFNVPKCPDAFLDFLHAVRQSGCLDSSVPGLSGPPVVHCSAGIGRSGTFCLVDSCLVMAANGEDLTLDLVKETLMDMRTYRFGLVQTEEQLRFSISAIIAGADRFVAPLANGALPDFSLTDNTRVVSQVVVNGKRIPDRRSESPTLPKKRKNSIS